MAVYLAAGCQHPSVNVVGTRTDALIVEGRLNRARSHCPEPTVQWETRGGRSVDASPNADLSRWWTGVRTQLDPCIRQQAALVSSEAEISVRFTIDPDGFIQAVSAREGGSQPFEECARRMLRMHVLDRDRLAGHSVVFQQTVAIPPMEPLLMGRIIRRGTTRNIGGVHVSGSECPAGISDPHLRAIFIDTLHTIGTCLPGSDIDFTVSGWLSGGVEQFRWRSGSPDSQIESCVTASLRGARTDSHVEYYVSVFVAE